MGRGALVASYGQGANSQLGATLPTIEPSGQILASSVQATASHFGGPLHPHSSIAPATTVPFLHQVGAGGANCGQVLQFLATGDSTFATSFPNATY